MSSLIAELERQQEKPSDLDYWRAKRLRVGMLTREQCLNIYHLLVQTVSNGVAGDVVELGCHEGGGAILIQKILDSVGSNARLHLYDSFEGIPENTPNDAMQNGKYFFPRRGLLQAAEQAVRANFAAANLRQPEIHPGWFADTLHNALPAKICFAHLDGDLYSSTLEGLEAVYPRLSARAVVVIDDYCDPRLFPHRNILPGVKAACDEFLADKPERIQILHGGLECHACIVKAPAD